MHLESSRYSRFPNRVNNKIKICFSTNCQAHLTLSFSLSFSLFLFSLSIFIFFLFFFFLRTRCKEINFLNASALFFVPFSVNNYCGMHPCSNPCNTSQIVFRLSVFVFSVPRVYCPIFFLRLHRSQLQLIAIRESSTCVKIARI